ncbi:unnamed protein product, partial [Mesorhabditis belari]|uniref:HEAT repeat-containing protein 1 n=1 Tax=Mesorhabditis belari TaxID=2138241 RepID=A0AAF3FT52_9BILA
MSSKRKKNDSSDEESDEVDWQREYRKMSKEFYKKMERLKESREECRMKRGELREMSSKNRELERRLKWANETLLGSQSMLNVRGVIEFLEGKQEMPDSVRQSDRHDRWKWIFDNDSKFSNEYTICLWEAGHWKRVFVESKGDLLIVRANSLSCCICLRTCFGSGFTSAIKTPAINSETLLGLERLRLLKEEAYIAKAPALSNAQRDSEAVSAQRYWIAMGTRTDIVSDKVNFICNTNSIHLFLARLISETLNDRKLTFSMKEKTLPLCNAKLKHDENGIDEKQLDSLIEILNGWTGPKKIALCQNAAYTLRLIAKKLPIDKQHPSLSVLSFRCNGLSTNLHLFCATLHGDSPAFLAAFSSLCGSNNGEDLGLSDALLKVEFRVIRDPIAKVVQQLKTSEVEKSPSAPFCSFLAGFFEARSFQWVFASSQQLIKEIFLSAVEYRSTMRKPEVF